MLKFLKFPQNFFWGVATSAHQIEGNNINSDWWSWEKKRCSDNIRKGRWSDEDCQNFISGKAADHWLRYRKDVQLIKELNCGAYRCSIEWARVEPERGEWSEEALARYRDEFEMLKKNNMKIFVTLFHYTLPQWVAAKGGWSDKKTIEYFLRFTQFVHQEFKDLVDYWITYNEPSAYIANGYFFGKWPPQRINPLAGFFAFQNLVRVHKEIYRLLHEKDEGAQIGIAENVNFIEPFKESSALDALSAFVANTVSNRLFLNQVAKHSDFVGVNYYFHSKIQFPFIVHKSNKISSDIGWEIYPEGIAYVAEDIFQRYRKPIFITENGIADAKDALRRDFIAKHLEALHKAIEWGVDVRGYFHWSLIDNFEWADGFSPRFGLYEVDYSTMERRPRSSVYYYAEICKNNGLYIE